MFPRRQATPRTVVPGYIKYSTDAAGNLDALFPHLNAWLFDESCVGVNICLFKAGRKLNYGILERNNEFMRHLICTLS